MLGEAGQVIFERLSKSWARFAATLTGIEHRPLLDEVRIKAQLIVNLCVGGMLIARTTDDSGLRKQPRATARSEALRLLAGDE